MVTLRNIVEALSTLDDISDMTAKVGPWTVKVWEYRDERKIDFVRKIQRPTEAEMKEMRETVGDD